MGGMPKVLVVSNDFPTRQGGIEGFVAALAERFSPEQVVVYTASMPGGAEYDAQLAYPVIRDRSSMLLPTPWVRRRVVAAFREHGCDRVMFGAAAPLALLAPHLRKAGAQRIIALTHSHETWWSRLPGFRTAIRRIGKGCDTVTYCATWCGNVIGAAMRKQDAASMKPLAAGADVSRFHPDCGGDRVRAKLGLRPEQPVVTCVARLVPRKGQDMLIKAWDAVRSEVPDAVLLIVGGGPHRKNLEKMVRARGLDDAVRVIGPVPWAEVPPYVDAGNVFAMPSRTRLRGLEPEGLPLAFMEAAACGLPVVVGRSGGAPDAVVDGVTGHVVDPRNVGEIARTLVALLKDPAAARAMGERGRTRVVAEWQWDHVSKRCHDYLGMTPAN